MSNCTTVVIVLIAAVLLQGCVSKMEIPSTYEEHRVLRTLLRNSAEMDQTGFHEQEAESQDIRQEMTPALENSSELETDEILGSMESQESRLGQSASKEVSRMTDSTTPKDEGTSLPCTKNVLHIDQQQEDFDRETGMPEVFLEDSIDTSVTDLTERPEEKIDVNSIEQEKDVDNGINQGKNEAETVVKEGPESSPTSDGTAPLFPPPFLVTKPISGMSYVYQLRFPTPQPNHLFQDFVGSGLNSKNVYGPPLPLDLRKLMEEIQDGGAMSPTPAFQITSPSSGKGAVPNTYPNVYVFLKMMHPHGS